MEFFVQQTLADHTSGTVVSAETDVAGTVNGAHSKGGTTLAVEDFSLVETFAEGDSIVIAGNTQRYVITADATLAAGAGTLSIAPPLVQDYADTTVVNAETIGAANYADRYYANLLFHKNAFAFATAPLPETGHGAGARMATITDPRTGLSLRIRFAYDDAPAKVLVTLDILYGVKCLDPNLAVVVRRNYA
jgi:hypothetical protein